MTPPARLGPPPQSAPENTPQISIDAAATAFSDATGEDAQRIDALTVGFGHLAWKVASPSGHYLLKTGIRRVSPADMHRQITAQQLAAAGGVTVPQVVAADDAAERNALGRPYYVQTWLTGHDAAAVLPDDPAQRADLAERIGRAVAGMHTVTGPRFAEDAAGYRSYPSWTAACRSRLAKVVDDNRTASILDDRRLDAMAARLKTLIDGLPDGIRPALTHRDLYLPNLIDRGPHQEVGIIDFEAAAFYDPLWDLVKPGMWIFERHPDLQAPFLEGYQAVRRLPDDTVARLSLYRGIEYLAGVPYFGRRWPDPAMLAAFQARIDAWPDPS
ncbi:phosphotransferase family protein [Actinomadura atramentaria]|uniref:phosphotransferase family protein n=1 Tax=Actinomadura atramentaria TaxID=1990 RepID=UPI0003744064|nr:aminoglycoside phosphotransferase family protein [Actinomadura atramentaria]